MPGADEATDWHIDEHTDVPPLAVVVVRHGAQRRTYYANWRYALHRRGDRREVVFARGTEPMSCWLREPVGSVTNPTTRTSKANTICKQRSLTKRKTALEICASKC